VEVLRKVGRLLGRERRWRWVLLVVLALVVSGFEALGALFIYMLMGLVTAPDEALSLPGLGDLAELFPGWSQRELVLAASALIAVFFLVRAVLFVGEAYLQHRMAHNAAARLSVRLLRGYLAMPYEFHLRRNSSELIRNTFDTVQVLVREVLVPAARLISEACVVLAIVAVLLWTAPQATFLALVVLGPIVTVLLRVVHPRLKRLGATSQAMSSASLKALAQSLQGVRELKILARESEFKREFAEQRAAYARAQYLRGGAREIPRAALETMLILFILGFFAVTVLIGGSTQASLSVLGLFAYAALRLKPSLSVVLSGLNSVKFAAPAVDDLYTDVCLIEERAATRERVSSPLPFQGSIRLDAVCFAYEQSDTDVLRDIDLVVHRGDSIGIVGPTGGGKSTLVDVILGLLQPTKGQVLVDGVDVHENTARWQRNVGVVPQTVFLIDGSLRQNICFGVPEDEIEPDKLAEAVTLAQLDTYIASLPAGLDTWVGERGVRVSGGQRQRIAIARALYRRPSVLVFDEGTSALDNVTEAEFIRALERLRGERTILTIAHRLSTVQACDRIVLLKDGAIADVGTYDELLDRNTDFRAMASAT
jgi:ATP-binding cassette, subfamily B, bacterial PglK